MPSIIYRTDAKTGNVFAYKATSFRDPVTKRPRSKQEYLGRVDPVTGDILPKGENGRRNRTSSTIQLHDAENQISQLKRELADSKKRIEYLEEESRSYREFLDMMKEAIRHQEDLMSQQIPWQRRAVHETPESENDP